MPPYRIAKFMLSIALFVFLGIGYLVMMLVQNGGQLIFDDLYPGVAMIVVGVSLYGLVFWIVHNRGDDGGGSGTKPPSEI